MIKVTLEFVSVDQAIVALGKLAGTGKVQAAAQEAAVSPSPATPRKGRSDKGKARGPQSADRKSTRLNSSHSQQSRMPSSA